MLDYVTAMRFSKRLGSGRTRPPLIDCERESGDEVEVIMKLSGSECGVLGIVRETIMALMAADLSLPISEPVLVRLVDGFADALPTDEAALATEIKKSIFPTFGSRRLPAGFSVWSKERPLDENLVEGAAEIFAFDALTLNPDRRVKNPNCQCNGTDFAIYDHEYGLMSTGVGTVLLPAPWQQDGVRSLTHGDGEHVLYYGLRGRGATLARLQAAWGGISEARFSEYCEALPETWSQHCSEFLNEAAAYLESLRGNLAAAFDQVRGVLT